MLFYFNFCSIALTVFLLVISQSTPYYTSAWSLLCDRFKCVCGLPIACSQFCPVSLSICTRSVLQALHGCCERAVRGAVIPGCGLEWAQHYRKNVESDQHCLNEWGAMTGLESVRKATVGRSSSNRESVEREIKTQLRDIMRTEDLENITSKQVKWVSFLCLWNSVP